MWTSLLSLLMTIAISLKTLWGLFLLIVPVCCIGAGLLFLKKSPEEKINKYLYKLIKKKGKIEDVKAYLKVFENSNDFNIKKKEFETEKFKEDLIETVSDSSYKIKMAEMDYRAALKRNNKKEPQVNITLIDDEQEESNVERLGDALPLIARMIKENKKVVITGTNLENEEKTNENTLNDD